MAETFPLAVRWWARALLMSRRVPTAVIDGGELRVNMGWTGHAEVPLRLVDRVDIIDWPWWGGVGARLAGHGLVAFVSAPGRLAQLELSEPLEVRAPMRWTARRIAVGAQDVDGFVRAVVRARRDA